MIGEGAPPDALSNPLRLNTIFMAGHRTSGGEPSFQGELPKGLGTEQQRIVAVRLIWFLRAGRQGSHEIGLLSILGQRRRRETQHVRPAQYAPTWSWSMHCPRLAACDPDASRFASPTPRPRLASAFSLPHRHSVSGQASHALAHEPVVFKTLSYTKCSGIPVAACTSPTANAASRSQRRVCQVQSR